MSEHGDYSSRRAEEIASAVLRSLQIAPGKYFSSFHGYLYIASQDIRVSVEVKNKTVTICAEENPIDIQRGSDMYSVLIAISEQAPVLPAILAMASKIATDRIA